MPSEKSPAAYRTISEASEEAGLPAHVLRFWETKFSVLRPLKRKGGRRLYRPQDVALLKGLKRLLHEDGLTIKGAQKYLREHGVAAVAALGDAQPAAQGDRAPADEAPRAEPGASTAAPRRERLASALSRLEAAKSRLDDALQR